MFLAEETKIVSVMRPLDITGAAITTEWISLRDYAAADFILDFGVVHASLGTPAVTLKVADDASGTHSAKISSASTQCLLTLPFYHKTSTGDTLTKVSVSSSTFNLAHTSDAKFFVIHVDANHMGTFVDTSVTYNADYVALSVAAAGAGATLAACSCILSSPRYSSDSNPTAIT